MQGEGVSLREKPLNALIVSAKRLPRGVSLREKPLAVKAVIC